MNSTTEICEDKERVKLRKEMLVQSKLEHCSVFGSYLEFMISNSYTNLVRHRPAFKMNIYHILGHFIVLDFLL